MIVRRAFLVSLLATAAFAALATSASAVIVHLKSGKAVSYFALRGSGTFQPFDFAFTNLDYNGGPVMSSNTNYAVYWRPSGAPAYPTEYQQGVNQFFEDLAHDSGSHQNVDSVATQYNDAEGEFANYNSHFGGPLLDTDPYPAFGCKATAKCLTDAQLQKELEKFVSANGLPEDFGHEYFLITPPEVEDCFEASEAECSAGTPAAKAKYCAYHSAFETATGGVIIYANDPFVTGNPHCDDGNHPNNKPSDGLIEGGLSHEHNESVTDPGGGSGWADLATGKETGLEDGDKCRGVGEAQEYGEPLGEVEVAGKRFKYNQVINGHFYWYQQEWSNQGHGCRQRFEYSGAQPSATFTSTAGPGTELKFNAGASSAPGGVAHYGWQFSDGSEPVETVEPTVSHTFAKKGLHFVALTVFAANGTSYGSVNKVRTERGGPTAAFSPAAALAGRSASFSSASSDPGGSIVASLWNFGDGSMAETASSSVSHIYAQPGTYTVTLLVLDSVEQIASVSHQIVVDEPPTAAFSVATPSPTAGQPVPFDASASSDPDGSITAYSWSFGDGSAAGAGVAPSHTFAAAGSYTVTLTVTDSAGAQSSVSRVVAVGGPSTLASTPLLSGSPLNPKPPAHSGFAVHASFDAKSGTITVSLSVASAGTLRWLATFANGRFGVFASRVSKCRPGQVRLRGSCRPARVTYGRGSKTAAAGSVTFKIKPTIAARRALRAAARRRKGVPVTLAITFQSVLGGAAVTHATVTTVRLKH